MKKLLFVLFISQFLTAQDKQPNILFLFVDDLAFDAVASHGNKQVVTPNIDRLTTQSTHFTHAYNSGTWSGAVCLASRTQMMTGQKVWHAAALSMGIRNNTNPDILDEVGKSEKIRLRQLADAKLFWPQLLEKKGYETYYAGKWHVGGNPMAEATWQHTRNLRAGMPRQLNSRYSRTFEKGSKSSWSPINKANGGYWEGGKHWSEILRDDAFEFLEMSKNSDKPFLMTIAFNAPHDPKQAPQEYQEMYPYDSVKIPENFITEYPHDFGANKIRDERLAPFPRTPYSIQVNRSEYYALITHLDVQIGRILDRLEETGQADNTYIFFTADHGLAVGQHGMMGKQNMYDHSIRVPWLISGPGIPKNVKNSSPIYLQDVMATTLEIANIDKPKYVEFNSVLPLVKGTCKKEDTVVYSTYLNYQRMVRSETFKYIIYPVTGVELLYNIKKDPLEIRNIVNEKSSIKDLEIMRKLLAIKMEEFSDPLDLKDPINSYSAYQNKKKKTGH